MLIKVIDEFNYLDELAKGDLILNEKFAKFEAIRNLPEEEAKQRSSELFQDPTIWAYATLKDPENNSFRLRGFQDLAINNKSRFVNVAAANQIGKSMLAIVKALHHALFVPNASVLIISASEGQAIMILDEIKWLMQRAKVPLKNLIGDVENRTELHLQGPNNTVSVIRCFPPTKGVLGFHATLEILDEGNFWEKNTDLSPIEYYDQVLEPRTNETKNWKHPFLTMGQIFMISNPNGEQGIGWRSYSKDSRFNNYEFCWLSHKANTLEEYNEARKRLPYYRFASIYAAKYVTASGGFITQEQYNKFVSYNADMLLPDGVIYLGGDFAGEDVVSRGRDSNVLFAVYAVGKDKLVFRVCYYRVWPAGTKTNEIYNEIARLHKSSPIAKFCYDKVGIGDKVKNDLMERQILGENQIEALTYSLPNKSEVYLNMQRLFEHGQVEGTDIPELREQILGLKVEQKEGSVHLKIHHERESKHDDFPDALANALWAARDSIVSVSAQFVQRGGSRLAENKECKHIYLEHDEQGELVCKSCGEQL